MKVETETLKKPPRPCWRRGVALVRNFFGMETSNWGAWTEQLGVVERKRRGKREPKSD